MLREPANAATSPPIRLKQPLDFERKRTEKQETENKVRIQSEPGMKTEKHRFFRVLSVFDPWPQLDRAAKDKTHEIAGGPQGAIFADGPTRRNAGSRTLIQDSPHRLDAQGGIRDSSFAGSLQAIPDRLFLKSFRRLRGNGSSGPPDRRLGRQRLRQDSISNQGAVVDPSFPAGATA